MDYESHFRAAVDRVRGEGRYRVFADLERQVGRYPVALRHTAEGPREVTIWCSNDYLGMGHHPAVLEAGCAAMRGYGAGAGGTRNIAGTTHLHVLLERELAALHGKEAALVLTSGYVANDAAISTIARLLPNCLILSDELNHASMIAGVRGSGCEKHVFRHKGCRHRTDSDSR
jgi:5-aminolevulinate synthase